MKHNFDSVEHEVIYKKLVESLNLSPVEESPSFTSQSEYFNDIHAYLKTMNGTRENYAYRHISSHRRILGPTIVFVKKVIRKILKWYIEPITFQQTKFNSAVTPAIGRLTELVGGVKDEVNSVEGKVADFHWDLGGINKRIDSVIAASNDYQQKLENEIVQLKEQNLRTSKMIEEQQNLIDFQSNKSKEIFRKLDSLDEHGVFDNKTFDFFQKKSYSQSGEDSILAYILRVIGINPSQVDYIDLGANHAREMSNTYYFYSQGARGVIVEANPELIPELKFYRSGDIILNNCVDVKSDDTVDFYLFNGDGLSTPDYQTALKYCSINPDLKIIGKQSIKTITLPEILDTYFVKGPTILSIDIEGKDIEILQSINFSKYRPLLIVIEMIEYATTLAYSTKNEKIKSWLDTNDYDEYAFTGINSIFIDRRQIKERNP
ncbi:FkbM family methyltransferase [Paenibacillus timonensis]|uniref:FkbM family methyltransferase n=1 Tax=Paenibacillus timonensis TaxID=225915 RepID=UPI0022E9351F|nr:FkbM family methyltransferase [Paenibacillus timonensis]